MRARFFNKNDCSYKFKNTIQFWNIKPIDELHNVYRLPVQLLGLLRIIFNL